MDVQTGAHLAHLRRSDQTITGMVVQYSRTAELGPWCLIGDLTLRLWTDVYPKLQAEGRNKNDGSIFWEKDYILYLTCSE